MAGVNKVILVGNLGADPEARSFSNGGEVVNLRVATSETWKDKQTGEKKEATEWHRVVFYRGLAEVVGEYLTQGSTIYVEGKLKQRTWQNSDGTLGFGLSVSASLIQPLALIGNKKPKKPRAEKAKNGAVGEASAAVHQPLPFNDDIGF